jgi:hypothetical protein
MKKLALTLALTILSASVLAGVDHNVQFNGFDDAFQATVTGFTSPTVTNIPTANDGQLKVLGTPSCSGNLCTFHITDVGSGNTSGTLTFDIGDKAAGNYCEVQIGDGSDYTTPNFIQPACHGTAQYQNDYHLLEWHFGGSTHAFTLNNASKY